MIRQLFQQKADLNLAVFRMKQCNIKHHHLTNACENYKPHHKETCLWSCAACKNCRACFLFLYPLDSQRTTESDETPSMFRLVRTNSSQIHPTTDFLATKLTYRDPLICRVFCINYQGEPTPKGGHLTPLSHPLPALK